MTAHTARRRCVRFAIIAGLCLLLGVVTTVGVAWAICACTETPQTTAADWSIRPAWPVTMPTDWPRADAGFSAVGAGRTVVHALATTSQGAEYYSVYVYNSGWPWRAMRAVQRTNENKIGFWSERNAWNLPSFETGLVWIDRRGAPVIRLPLMLLFPGFLADTALYATAWYLLIFAPLPLIRAGRRRFRVSRGMCPACAYDLKGSPSGPCPECGT